MEHKDNIYSIKKKMNKKNCKVNKEDNLKWTEKSDYQVVKDIIERADTKSLKEIAKLYYYVKNGKFAINSNRTRVALCLYLADTIAERIMNRKRSPIKATIGILCIFTAILLAISIYFSNEHAKQLEEATKELHQMHHVVDDNTNDTTEQAVETEFESNEDVSINEEDTEVAKQMIPELVELYGVNQDLFGWICIDGTEIDYPIVQASDNKYYLSHNFYKDEDSAGTLFVDYRNVGVSDTNLIVYGHNMRNSKMFGKLKNYEDYGFYQQHQTISLETLYEKHTSKTGLVIMDKQVNITPTIYLDGFYTRFASGEPMDALCKEIMELYEENRLVADFDMSMIRCFDRVKEVICLRLVNAKMNQELLENVPHVLYHDLAIVFYILLARDSHELATIMIQNKFLSIWQVTIEELYQRAICNTKRCFDIAVTPVFDMVLNAFAGDMTEKQKAELYALLGAEVGKVPLYEVSNRERMYGANVLLNTEFLKGLRHTKVEFVSSVFITWIKSWRSFICWMFYFIKAF